MRGWVEATVICAEGLDGGELLFQNNLLLAIADELSRKPDWGEVVRRFKESPRFERGSYSNSNLSGYLAETYVQILLEKACRQHGDGEFLEDSADACVVRHGDVTDSFAFEYDCDGKLVVFNLATGELHSEADAVFRAGDIGVLVEVKVSKKERVKDVYRDDDVSRAIEPFAEWFWQEYGISKMGYVVVLASDVVGRYGVSRDGFVERGGLVVPLYCKYDSYLEEVGWVRRKYGL